MQVNQIRSKLETVYNGLIDLSDARGAQNEENYFLTRALAAYSIQCLCEADTEDLARSITDGSGDNGVDAVYFDRNFDELYIVQSKWNHSGDNEPELGEVKKFIDGIEDLISLKFHKFNQKVQRRSDEIKSHLLNPKTKIKAILVYTAVNLSEEKKLCFDEFLERQNDSTEGTYVEIINQERLHNSLIDTSVGSPIVLEDVILTEWGKRVDPKLAYYGQVDGAQIAKWWNSYGNRLFIKNIRMLLGESDINIEIRKTIEANPEDFWYFNNGITIICDDINKRKVNGDNRDYCILDCHNSFVVNGAQTVGTIGKYNMIAEDPDLLDKVKVNVRIISLKKVIDESEKIDFKFAENITKNNNRQNKIQNRDFVSLDEQQKRIEKELAVEGITYHIMRSDETINDSNNFDLEESTVALSCAFDIDAATLAHREPGKIWSDLNHNRYKQLFNPSITSFYVWNTVSIFREIDESINAIIAIESNEKEAILTYGRELIICAIIDQIGKNRIAKNVIDTTSFLSGINLNDIVQSKLSSIMAIIDDYGNNIANIFKSFSKSKEIFNKIQEAREEREVTLPSIDNLIQTKFSSKSTYRTRLADFDSKISGNELSVKAFNIWLNDMYQTENHEIGIISNIHHYLKGEGDRNRRFLFRLTYNENLTFEFNHSSYGINYNSVLFEKEPFVKWLEENNLDGKLIISDEESISQLLQLNELL